MNRTTRHAPCVHMVSWHLRSTRGQQGAGLVPAHQTPLVNEEVPGLGDEGGRFRAEYILTDGSVVDDGPKGHLSWCSVC